MRVTTEIGDRREFVLKRALLIYEDQISKREQFATVHEIFPGSAETKEPQLGPGTLLTTGFLEQLCERLKRMSKPVILPENVLAYTSDLLVWWTPPRVHRMFFSDGAEDRREIDGRACPHPALVWKVRRGCLYLRALMSPQRPIADTPLMIAPYWNTEPSRGDVCEGDMPRPRETNVTNLLEWEEGFFNSRFTHPSGMGKLTRHPGGFIGLWKEMAGADVFRTEYLLASTQTLKEFAGEV